MSFPIPGHFIINFTSKRDQKRVLERRFGFNNPLKTSLRLAKKMKRQAMELEYERIFFKRIQQKNDMLYFVNVTYTIKIDFFKSSENFVEHLFIRQLTSTTTHFIILYAVGLASLHLVLFSMDIKEQDINKQCKQVHSPQ